MAILSKNTTIGGKIPLTTDILEDNVSIVVHADLSEDVDLNSITKSGSYSINNVTSIDNFPDNCTVVSINETGACLNVMSATDEKKIQQLIIESNVFIRHMNTENEWTNWENYSMGSNTGTGYGDQIEVSSIILKSSDDSNKKYKITINSAGNLVATEIE